MNQTRTPTTRTRCPTLFDKWHGMPIRRHGWTYQGLYLPSYGPLGGKSKCSGTRQIEHANHQTTMTAPSRGIHNTSLHLQFIPSIIPNTPVWLSPCVTEASWEHILTRQWVKEPLQCNSMSLFVCYTAVSYLSLTNSGDLVFLCFVLSWKKTTKFYRLKYPL